MFSRARLLKIFLPRTVGARKFGGHGGHPQFTNQNPYAPRPHLPEYPDQAYAFGRKPGAPLEGWEIITSVVYGTIAVMCAYWYMYDDRETFKEWAKKEWLAREKLREEGVEIEFGRWYHDVSTNYTNDEIDQAPKLEES